LRTLDYDMQAQINQRMKEMVPAIAKAYRAEATINIAKGYPITYNDPELTAQMLPSLKAAAGDNAVFEIDAITGAEDFSFFQKEVPGLYFFLGGKPVDVPQSEAAPHHTPDFFIDESGMLLGVKTFVQLTFDYLGS
ncbi:MAG: M20/M25/M40 family metallo-hydrolase, partial [Flavobacteriaceae bacterium]|nr:M20/M25/M40 family metallo-hydrolase [Bacteroidia bacterium]NNL61275.1 M20/M25/M40 family metallo-hydrolase [Flavobacteriaceae bacterium]